MSEQQHEYRAPRRTAHPATGAGATSGQQHEYRAPCRSAVAAQEGHR